MGPTRVRHRVQNRAAILVGTAFDRSYIGGIYAAAYGEKGVGGIDSPVIRYLAGLREPLP